MTLRRPSRLVRNTCAAGLLVVLTATGSALAATHHDGGSEDASCPAGQSWITAAAVAAAFSLSDQAGGKADDSTGPVLAGCVDLTRLHPMPSPADDRG